MQKVQAFDIWYVASPSGPLSRLFKLLPLGQKWPHPGADMFYLGLHRENLKNLLICNQKAQVFDIWYIASPSGLLQDCSDYSPGPKMAPPWDRHVLHTLI